MSFNQDKVIAALVQRNPIVNKNLIIHFVQENWVHWDKNQDGCLNQEELKSAQVDLLYSDFSIKIEADQRAACPICLEQISIHHLPAIFYQGTSRTCEHFCCSKCAPGLFQSGSKHCPLCRHSITSFKIIDLNSGISTIFSIFDLNNDGKLNKNEVLKGLCMMVSNVHPLAMERYVTQHFPIWDLDKSGTLDQREFTKVYKELLNQNSIHPPSLIVNPLQWFQFYDLDGSRALSVAELKYGFIHELKINGNEKKIKDLCDNLNATLLVFDDDHSGELNQKEFMEFFENCRCLLQQ